MRTVHLFHETFRPEANDLVVKAASWLLAPLLLPPGLAAQTGCGTNVPCYSAASIVNVASNQAGALAPYTYAMIQGTNLSYTTAVASPGRSSGAELPVRLGDAGVLVDGLPAVVQYVSPVQIYFIIPIALKPGEVTIQVTRAAQAGPAVKIKLLDYAPALFQADAKTVIALRSDFSGMITPRAPAKPGDTVILYATGLGDTIPPITDYEAPQTTGWITVRSQFAILLNGTKIDSSDVLFAGGVPLFAGLYQINMRVPEGAGKNPEIRISVADQTSPPGLLLPVQ